MEKKLQIQPHLVEAASGLKRTPHRTGFLALKSPFVQGRGSELPVCEVELADQAVQREGRAAAAAGRGALELGRPASSPKQPLKPRLKCVLCCHFGK